MKAISYFTPLCESSTEEQIPTRLREVELKKTVGRKETKTDAKTQTITRCTSVAKS